MSGGVLIESHVEEAVLGWLRELGYSIKHGSEIAPDTAGSERESYGDVILEDRLRKAVARLNPNIPKEAQEDAMRRILHAEKPSLVEENRRLHKALVEGVDVEYFGEDGVIRGDQVRLLDFDDLDDNDWLAVNQYTVIETKANRRPDVVIFINGLPVGVLELKNPGDENATLDGAFNQLQTYKAQIQSLFRTNCALVISDGLGARIGSLTADRERFMPWRTVDGDGEAARSSPELEVLMKGMFYKRRFLDLIRDFVVFGDTGSGLVKILAGYHQFHAVRHAMDCTLKATAPEGDRRVGVVWHTQGSGKSLLMAFYAGQVIKHPVMENPTLVIITDRNDLDDQLFGTFAMCKDLLRQTPQQAETHAELFKLLDRPSGGVIFTTIQKFAPQDGDRVGALTERRNVVVIADEAHRSQYGLKAKVAATTGEISYGFAKYLRDALPHASFVGFTGTPIEKDDVNTPRIFGEYIDVYDISRAVTDFATVPIFYESRLARIELDEKEKPRIDAEIDELTEDDALAEQERVKRKWASVEALVGAEKRINLIAQDLVTHFEARLVALDGKAMVVCMSRRICVALYDAIIKVRPEWHSEDDEKGAIKIVMTGSASDPAAWQRHIGKGSKSRRELLAKRAKDSADPLRLVIVRDMWLTGFDAPCMHTMYIDKPMKGHGLMQAIARVNRVFRDKPAGLVVDYIGVAQHLKNALSQYSNPDQENTGIDEEQAVAVLMEKHEVVRDMFQPDATKGFDYRLALQPEAQPQQRLAVLAGAMDWILTMQQEAAAGEMTDGKKKEAHRRYADAVLALTKAFALTSASDIAKEIRDEVGFFQAVRIAMVKSTPNGKKSGAARDFAIQQIVSRAVVSTEIIDIMKASGVQSPDISILSDEFLAEMQHMERKNLALEALRKLINGEVRSQAKKNVIQAKAFSERLEAAISRYHANAISTVQVLEELLALAKDVQKARTEGRESGLSDEEIAFYTALAQSESAMQAMGEPQLRVIAHELVKSLQTSVTVDWMHRDAARARLRVLVKKILRKYGYPPDLQDEAVQKVLQQAEALSAELAAAAH